jgi:hypothetical protein
MIEPDAENVSDLLDRVIDRDSFVRFVQALAKDRELAEQMELSQPARFSLGGARGWQNGDISSFLFACLAYFSPGPLNPREIPTIPSWKTLAEFLWVGKIYE